MDQLAMVELAVEYGIIRTALTTQLFTPDIAWVGLRGRELSSFFFENIENFSKINALKRQNFESRTFDQCGT